MAACLRRAGITPNATRDSSGRERVLPLGLPFSLTFARGDAASWYWNGKPLDVPDRERCCAPDAWAFRASHPRKGRWVAFVVGELKGI